MAKYQEIWEQPTDSTVMGYRDTETGREIPIAADNRHYREFLEWQAAGGVADPAYTTEEITAYQATQQQAEALTYLNDTAPLVQRFRDDTAAGRRPFIPESKYKNLLKKRARAQKLINKTFSNF